MCLLNTQQIALIANDVENEGINFSHLGADLVDHICCIIENQMEQGTAFDEAYRNVRMEFGIKGLRQIQQDTLMLIDKNYRIMKKSMKWIGVLAMALMAFGAVFKINHLPGAAIMLLLSFFFTTFVFFPTLLFVVYKEANQKKQQALFIFAFISGALFMMGVLFKILHWPYTSILMFAGIAGISYVLLPLIMISDLKKQTKGKRVLFLGYLSIIITLSGLLFKLNHFPGASLLLLVGCVGAVVLFLPWIYKYKAETLKNNPTVFVFSIIALSYFIILTFMLSIRKDYRANMDLSFQEKSYTENGSYFKACNQKNYFPEDDQNFYQKTEVIINQLEDLKIYMAQQSFHLAKSEAKSAITKDYFTNSDMPIAYLLPEINSASPLIDIHKNLKDLNANAQTMKDSLPQIVELMEIFKPNQQFVNKHGLEISWYSHYFGRSTINTTLHLISFWQYNLQLAQNTYLTASFNPQKNQ